MIQLHNGICPRHHNPDFKTNTNAFLSFVLTVRNVSLISKMFKYPRLTNNNTITNQQTFTSYHSPPLNETLRFNCDVKCCQHSITERSLVNGTARCCLYYRNGYVLPVISNSQGGKTINQHRETVKTGRVFDENINVTAQNFIA
jgi:hypothetical protein